MLDCCIFFLFSHIAHFGKPIRPDAGCLPPRFMYFHARFASFKQILDQGLYSFAGSESNGCQPVNWNSPIAACCSPTFVRFSSSEYFLRETYLGNTHLHRTQRQEHHSPTVALFYASLCCTLIAWLAPGCLFSWSDPALSMGSSLLKNNSHVFP